MTAAQGLFGCRCMRRGLVAAAVANCVFAAGLARGAVAGAEGSALETRSVTATTTDGVSIEGDYNPPAKAGGMVVVLLHGEKGDRSAWGNLVEPLRAKGLGVLAIDFRGFGGSIARAGGKVLNPGDFDDAEVQAMILDVEAAVDSVLRSSKSQPPSFAVVGADLGANVGLKYAAMHPSVKAVLLLSVGLDIRGIQTPAAMGALGGRPALLVQGQDDPESQRSSRELVKIGRGSRELWDVAGHQRGTDLLSASPDLVVRIADWLSKRAQP